MYQGGVDRDAEILESFFTDADFMVGEKVQIKTAAGKFFEGEVVHVEFDRVFLDCVDPHYYDVVLFKDIVAFAEWS